MDVSSNDAASRIDILGRIPTKSLSSMLAMHVFPRFEVHRQGEGGIAWGCVGRSSVVGVGDAVALEKKGVLGRSRGVSGSLTLLLSVSIV